MSSLDPHQRFEVRAPTTGPVCPICMVVQNNTFAMRSGFSPKRQTSPKQSVRFVQAAVFAPNTRGSCSRTSARRRYCLGSFSSASSRWASISNRRSRQPRHRVRHPRAKYWLLVVRSRHCAMNSTLKLDGQLLQIHSAQNIFEHFFSLPTGDQLCVSLVGALLIFAPPGASRRSYAARRADNPADMRKQIDPDLLNQPPRQEYSSVCSPTLRCALALPVLPAPGGVSLPRMGEGRRR